MNLLKITMNCSIPGDSFRVCMTATMQHSL